MKQAVVLLVDDEDELRRSTAQSLDLAGFAVATFAGAEEALDFDHARLQRRRHHRHPHAGHGRHDADAARCARSTPISRSSSSPAMATCSSPSRRCARAPTISSKSRSTARPWPTSPRRALDRRRLVLENRRLRAVAGKRDDIEARLPGRTQAMVDLRYRLRAVGADRRRHADHRRHRHRQGGRGARAA